ncbi:MAG: endonuclease/exonuclease/phosphatase family protein [Proteobacteria bacterium]|nr:endonuclease/exonuclease/phosphatase family protein [Pseudomonadota bacterium]
MNSSLLSRTTATSALALLLITSACTAPGHLPAAHVASSPVNEFPPVSSSNSIKVLSLNVAHSRSMGAHQILQDGDEARANLDAIVTMLKRENPDLVALQEVDGPSFWSGGFDHVAYLAQEAGFTATIRGTHMKTPGLDYGTAIMARHPMDEAVSIGFGGALSVVRKGFVISQMQWPGQLDFSIDVVSVHLDPIRQGVRNQQAAELAAIIEERGRPVIVMGDFNDDWHDEDSAARLLADTLGLNTHGARCEECYTHRRMKNFVDWILVSPELTIDDFEILKDDISDHYAISATLRLGNLDRDRGMTAH